MWKPRVSSFALSTRFMMLATRTFSVEYVVEITLKGARGN